MSVPEGTGRHRGPPELVEEALVATVADAVQVTQQTVLESAGLVSGALARAARDVAEVGRSGLKKVVAGLAAVVLAIVSSLGLLIVSKLQEITRHTEQNTKQTSQLRTDLNESSDQITADQTKDKNSLEKQIKAIDNKPNPTQTILMKPEATAAPVPKKPAAVAPKKASAPAAKPAPAPADPAAPTSANGVTQAVCAINPKTVGC